MPEERAREQLEATRALALASSELAKSIQNSPVVQELKKQNTKLQNQFNWMIAITVCLLLAFGGVGLLYAEQRDAAKTNCLNTNEVRNGNRILWDLVLVRSASQNPDRTPEEVAFAKKFEEWMHELYAPRDCDNLDKRYDIPPPPAISSKE